MKGAKVKGQGVRNKLTKIYSAMEKRFGDLKWWPAESPFEVAVGAILTQNTAWKNVEVAIAELKKRELLDPVEMASVRSNVLSKAIRSSGYHNQKTKKLKEFCRFLSRECDGDIKALREQETYRLRRELLEVNGIGPETADSILLYALGKKIFVVDAYTKRIFSRHGLISLDETYDMIQSMVHENFPGKLNMLNQLHALIVETGKNYCKKKAGECKECPLFGI